MADLGFLEVGLNPDVLVWHDRQEVGAGLNHLAVTGGALTDHATDRRVNFAAGQVQFSLGQVGAGVDDLRVEAFDFSGQGVDLLALALQVSLGLAHLRAGDMVFR
ncbi:hypothetical protein D3C81_1064060 [compost metagenome]